MSDQLRWWAELGQQEEFEKMMKEKNDERTQEADAGEAKAASDQAEQERPQ